MFTNGIAKSAMLASCSVFLANCCSLSAAEEVIRQQWDTRLNGIWKVTEYVVGGSSRDLSELRYVFSDGLIVSALPTSDESLELPAIPSFRDGSGPLASDAEGQAPPKSDASDELDDCRVKLTVYRAKISATEPHSWIELTTQWGDSDASLRGLYEVNGDVLRLAIGIERPDSLVPPKSDGYTPSSHPIVMTMVRLTNSQPNEGAESQE